MSSKIIQFQIAPDAFGDKGYDVAADWVFDDRSEMYQKYRNLNKEDFIKLLRQNDEESKMTKPQLIPIGAALNDRGILTPIVIDFDGTICPIEDVSGYMGYSLSREEIVDDIMLKMRNP
jgi:hypothetical protein